MADKNDKTMFRVEFTVERNGKTSRKKLEGANIDKLMAKVEKLDGYQVVVSKEVFS
jgi:hypothetical protein